MSQLSEFLSQGGSRYSSLSGHRYGPYGRGTYETVGRAGRTIGRALKSWMSRPKAVRQAAKEEARARKKKSPLTAAIKTGLVKQEGSSVSRTLCNYGQMPNYSKKIDNLSAPQHYVMNVAGGNTQSTAGIQNAFQVPWLNVYQLGACAAVVNASEATRFLLEHMHGTLMLSSASVFSTTVTLYDVIARRDLPTSAIGDPVNAWSTGLTEEGAGSYQTIGSTPFESELFNQFYKVVQTTEVDIPSGGVHRHVVDFRPYAVIHQDVVNQQYGGALNAGGGIRGITCFTLVKYHGSPAHDSTTNTAVTISPASLDAVQSFDIQFRGLLQANVSWQRKNNLATSFAVGAQIVNDLVGQVQDAGGLHPGTLLS